MPSKVRPTVPRRGVETPDGGVSLSTLARVERAIAGASRYDRGAIQVLRQAVRRMVVDSEKSGASRSSVVRVLGFMASEHPDRASLERRSVFGRATEFDRVMEIMHTTAHQ